LRLRHCEQLPHAKSTSAQGLAHREQAGRSLSARFCVHPVQNRGERISASNSPPQAAQRGGKTKSTTEFQDFVAQAGHSGLPDCGSGLQTSAVTLASHAFVLTLVGA